MITPSHRLDSAAPPSLASAVSSLSFSGTPSAFLRDRDTPCTSSLYSAWPYPPGLHLSKGNESGFPIGVLHRQASALRCTFKRGKSIWGEEDHLQLIATKDYQLFLLFPPAGLEATSGCKSQRDLSKMLPYFKSMLIRRNYLIF